MGTCASVCSTSAGAAVAPGGPDAPAAKEQHGSTYEGSREGEGPNAQLSDSSILSQGSFFKRSSGVQGEMGGGVSRLGSGSMIQRLKYRSQSHGQGLTDQDGKPVPKFARRESKKYFTSTSSPVVSKSNSRDEDPGSRKGNVVTPVDDVDGGQRRAAARRMRKMSLAPSMGMGIMTVDSNIADVFQGGAAGQKIAPIAHGGGALLGVHSLAMEGTQYLGGSPTGPMRLATTVGGTPKSANPSMHNSFSNRSYSQYATPENSQYMSYSQYATPENATPENRPIAGATPRMMSPMNSFGGSKIQALSPDTSPLRGLHRELPGYNAPQSPGGASSFETSKSPSYAGSYAGRGGASPPRSSSDTGRPPAVRQGGSLRRVAPAPIVDPDTLPERDSDKVRGSNMLDPPPDPSGTGDDFDVPQTFESMKPEEEAPLLPPLQRLSVSTVFSGAESPDGRMNRQVMEGVQQTHVTNQRMSTMSVLSGVSGVTGVTGVTGSLHSESTNRTVSSGGVDQPNMIGLSRDALYEHMLQMDEDEEGSERDMQMGSGGVQMAIRNRKRVSISASSNAESFVEDLELPEHEPGSLAAIVFGEKQRMARMPEDELGGHLLAMEEASGQRQPLSASIRGMLLNGSALAEPATMHWVAKLKPGKVVRFFFSSTFTDTELERNLFLEDCVPFLRRVTALAGLEFQVSEMRWGINNKLSESHRTSRECMKELNRCLESSTGLAFFGLVGDRYGYRPFPPVIEAELFDKMVAQVTMNTGEASKPCMLLRKWFALDTNTRPPVYRLSPIHAHLPSYIDMSPEGSVKRREAEAVWWGQCFEPMQYALRKAAIKLLEAGEVSEQVADTFVRSVTEEEMMKGICEAKKSESSRFWGDEATVSNRSALVIRNLVGIKEGDWADPVINKYIDKDEAKQGVDEEAAELMSTLRERLLDAIPQERLFEFDVEWQKGGLDPAKHETHRLYLADLADTMCRLNMEEIVAQLSTRPLVNDLESEMMHHMHLCQKKCETFAAREGILDQIAKFFDDADGPSTMMVVGQSGMGKSCLLAEAASRLTKTLKVRREATGKPPPFSPASFEEMREDDSMMQSDPPLVLLRFIGTTHKSMRAREIMQSCCQQITSYYSSLPEDVPAEYLALKDALPNSFARATKERPLYVILDALDQISDSAAGKNLDWLPMGAALPPHVKLLVSTLKTGSTRRAVTKRCGEFAATLKLEGFLDGERETMLDEWLLRDGRQLTDSQRGLLLNASNSDSSSLLLRMLYERSLEWNSSTSISAIGWVPNSAEDAVNLLFDELEQVHSNELVRLVLGAITASKEGMSAGELEDLASSSDEVLLALFVWWAPPMARVPPLQVVRLLHDLESYLSETVGSGSNIVYQWAHRQFKEQALKRYVQGKEETLKVHDALADLFSGGKAKRNLPLEVRLLNGEVKQLPGDRRLPTQEPVLVRVAGEPVVYNERMLRELPHHYVQAKRFQDLLDLITNFEVFEYFASDSNNAVLAKLWRSILEARPTKTPRDEYMRMLDDLEEDVKERKEAALARCVGEFLSTLLARLEDATAFMFRAVFVSEAAGNQLDTAKGLDGVGKVLYYHGKYDESYNALERSLEIKKRELGDKSLEVATTMHFIADVFQKQSKLNEALKTYLASCELRKELQGPDSSDVAVSLGCLGVLYKKLGDYQAALNYFEQSREIFEMRLGKDNLTVAVALMNIANLFKYVGKYEEAISKHLESIAIKKRILGSTSNHPEVAKSLGNLAIVYEKVGRLDEAMEVNVECLEIQKKSLGPKSQDVARTLKGMGIILSEQGKVSQAVSVLNEALSITISSVGRKHRDVVAILIVCADALYLQGFHDDALGKFSEAITIMRGILGNDRPHVDIARGLRGLGNVLLSKGDEVDALKNFEEALKVYIAVVGKEHVDSSLCLDLVASTLFKMGKFEEALEKHLEAREWRKATEAHPRDLAANLVYSADVYAKLGDYTKALSDYNEALALQTHKDTVGPAVAQTHNRLGIVYKKLGKYPEALKEYEHAKDVLYKLFGSNHLSVAVVNMNLGNVYQHLGHYELSLKSHQDSLEVKKKFLGDKNMEVATSLGNMGSVYERLGRLKEAEDMFRQCLEIQQTKQKGRSLEVARTLRGMGAIQRAQGLYAESLESYNKSRDITLECVGTNHLDVAQIALAIGGVLVKQQSEIRQAEERFNEAIKITKDVAGENHQIVAAAVKGLGDVLRTEERWKEALEQYTKSTAIMTLLVGNVDNLDVATTKYCMSHVQRKLGLSDDATANLKDAERVFSEVLGPDHHWTVCAGNEEGELL